MIKKIYLYLKGRQFLVLGTVCLILSWRLETNTIRNYQSDLDRGKYRYSEFLFGIQNWRAAQVQNAMFSTMYSHDSSSVTTYNLCQSYVDRILAAKGALEAGKIMAEEGGNFYDVKDDMMALMDHLKKLRDAGDVNSLIAESNEIGRQLNQETVRHQDLYKTDMIETENSLETKQDWLTLLAAIGVIFLAVDRGIKGVSDQEYGDKMETMLSSVYNRKKSTS